MAEAKKMVTGFNHNVKHLGRVYHVQTEDSGLSNPHIITHLFVGGNILASKKTSYADITGAENLTQVVRELMEEQHKEMLRNLVNGVYDDPGQSHGARGAQHYQPGQLGVEAPTGHPPPLSITVPVGGPPPTLTPSPPLPAAAAPPAVEWKGDAGATLIGEELISEKTLDEVILSYLAEDAGERK
ncbi:MAG: hypothetical protein HZB56_09655 [Deltaproteobacteria bacterium]|nr:hypothetical protein [Deltaproteobacteria bacterium]